MAKGKRKIKFGLKSTRICLHPKLYGCMFPGSSCCTQTETDGNILYVALLLLLGGDVTQFSLGMVNIFFYGVLTADDYADMQYSCSILLLGCLFKVMNWSWSKSCALHPHPTSCIIMHSYSSLCRWWCRKFIFFILCTIICTCHLISLIQTYHPQPLVPASTKSYLHQTPVVFQFTSYYIFDSF